MVEESSVTARRYVWKVLLQTLFRARRLLRVWLGRNILKEPVGGKRRFLRLGLDCPRLVQ